MNKRIIWINKAMHFGKTLLIAGTVLLPGLSYSAGLERLFSTPSERLYLNQLRSTGKVKAVLPDSDTNSGFEPPANTPVRFNGFVKRSSGRTDAWVNGQHVGADQMLMQKLDAQNRMQVQVPDSDRTVRMKPGQVMDPVTGRVGDVHEIQELTQSRPQAEVKQ